MDLTESQFQSLVDELAERMQTRGVAAALPPMVQLPPEFYQSQREIAERVARQEERFEQIDRRFEQVERRFEQIERRFEQIDKRFEELVHYMDKRFDQVDKRFEDLIHYVDRRFESVEKRLSFQQWLIGAGFLVLTALMTVYQFLA